MLRTADESLPYVVQLPCQEINQAHFVATGQTSSTANPSNQIFSGHPQNSLGFVLRSRQAIPLGLHSKPKKSAEL